jgi:hypothetical protein
MEARIAVLEHIAKDTRELLGRIDSRMDRMDTRFDRMDTRMDRFEDRQISDFGWLLIMGIGTTAFLFATMAHGFHWF